jgi:hypothetical protein
MKKINLLCIFVILLLSSQSINSATIKHTYHFSPPNVQQQSNGMSLVYFPNCYQAGKIGEPTLPVYPISLLLPPGQATDKFKLIFKGKTKLDQKIILSPKQTPRKTSDSPSQQYFNHQIYNSADVYSGFDPEVQTHFFFGHAIALACFSPIEYIPANGELFYYSEVKVEITTHSNTRAMEAQKNFRSSKDIIKKLAKIVDNFEQIIGMYPYQNDEAVYDYLIITIHNFIDDYQTLAHFYNERGIKAQIVTVEEIYQSTSGADEPDKIRNYIITQVQESGISYVLLAGDADLNQFGEMQVPIRGLYCKVLSGEDVYEDKNIPSDLYYAALDGNWNDDGDDMWGEPGEDDLLPELAVARICADSSTEINAILNKIISYQSNPIVEDATKMLMVGEKMWNDPLSYGADYLDLLIGNRDDNGYATVGMPLDLNFTYLYDRTLGSWNRDDLIQNINNGCNIIHHAGHSSSGTNMRMSRSDITNENFFNIDGTNRMNPIIYSHGCLSAAVDITNISGQDCIGEMMLEINNFASAYIGNTRYGWFNEGQTEGPSLHLHREFISALYGDSVVAIGAAHTVSRIRSAPFVTAPDQWEPGALRWCFYGCNVLGDPAMSIWTNQIKEFANVNYPARIWDLPANISVQTGIVNVRVTISDNGNLLATATTNNFGEAYLTIDSTLTSSALDLTITAINYKPFVGKISLATTGVNDQPSSGSISFELKPLFPNPFNHETTIQFSITKTSHVNLEVYNLNGQKIKTIFNNKLKPGTHQFNWNGRDEKEHIATSGLYFVKLETDEGIQLRNCILLK